jgi:hypothetical protein
LIAAPAGVLRGARSIENEGEFGEVRIHAHKIAYRHGQKLSHPPIIFSARLGICGGDSSA